MIRRAELGELKNASIRNQLNRNFSRDNPRAPTVDELLQAYYTHPDNAHKERPEDLEGRYERREPTKEDRNDKNNDDDDYVMAPGFYSLMKRDGGDVLKDHIKKGSESSKSRRKVTRISRSSISSKKKSSVSRNSSIRIENKREFSEQESSNSGIGNERPHSYKPSTKNSSSKYSSKKSFSKSQKSFSKKSYVSKVEDNDNSRSKQLSDDESLSDDLDKTESDRTDDLDESLNKSDYESVKESENKSESRRSSSKTVSESEKENSEDSQDLESDDQKSESERPESRQSAISHASEKSSKSEPKSDSRSRNKSPSESSELSDDGVEEREPSSSVKEEEEVTIESPEPEEEEPEPETEDSKFSESEKEENESVAESDEGIYDFSKGKIVKQKFLDGKLRIRLIHGKGLISREFQESNPSFTPNPYAVFLLPGGSIYRSKPVKNTPNPIWTQEINLPATFDKGNIEDIEIYVFDSKANFGDFSQSVGKTSYLSKPLLKKPGVWVYNEIRELKYTKDMVRIPQLGGYLGEIYAQLMWIPSKFDGQLAKPPKLLENLGKTLKKDLPVSGTLIVVVSHAKKLPGLDRDAFGSKALSDPYVKLVYPNGQFFSTKIKNETQTPIWNEKFSYKLTIKGDNFNPLDVTVFDHDEASNDDVIGFTNINLARCYKNPGEWAINGSYKLENRRKKSVFQNFGDIYIQAKFVTRPTDDDDDDAPPVSELIDKMVEDYDVKGTFYVDLRSLNLPRLPFDYFDTYVRISFPGGDKAKSKPLKNAVAGRIEEIIANKVFLKSKVNCIFDSFSIWKTWCLKCWSRIKMRKMTSQ